MKDAILNYSINTIRKKDSSYSEEQLAIIRYGFESIYILITKTIFIFMIAIILGIFKEVLIFTLLYNLIRTTSFGLHATKSWMCFVSSTLIFITIPYICKIIDINIIVRSIVGVISILAIYKNAPADTYKRPIVSKKRRDNFKFVSTIIAISMVFASLLIDNTFLHNSLLLSLVVQCFMISPALYKIFKLPYDNYKAYQNMG